MAGTVTLTEVEAAMGVEGNVEELYQSILTTLRSLDGHYWCHAPQLVQEVIPIIAAQGSEGAAVLRGRIGPQIDGCHACARQYHFGVDDFCRRSSLSQSEKESIRASLRKWDVERCLPRLAALVSDWKAATGPGGRGGCDEEERLRGGCANVFLELLLDGYLTMDLRVAKAIANMFVILNPLSDACSDIESLADARHGMLLPGVYVLCFHPSTAVCAWAQRCTQGAAVESQDDADPEVENCLAPSFRRLMTACLARVEHDAMHGEDVAGAEGHAASGSAKGQDDCVVIIDDEQSIEWSQAYGCSLSTVWSSVAIVVSETESLPLMRWILGTQPSFFSSLVHCLCDSRIAVVTNALTLLTSAMSILGKEFWTSEEDLSPLSLAENASSLFLSDLSNDVARKKVATLFIALVGSLDSSNRDEASRVVRIAWSLLFDASNVPKRRASRSLASKPYSSLGWQGERVGDLKKLQLVKSARSGLAKLISLCYLQLPYVVPSLDSDLVADLIAAMLAESGSVSPGAVELLRLILMADAANVVRFVTSADCTSMALNACPKSDEFSPTTVDLSSRAVDSLPDGDQGESDSDLSGAESEAGHRGYSFLPVATDMETLFKHGKFCWSEKVWEALILGSFHVLSRVTVESKRSAWYVFGALLDVHALVGMLDIRATDMSLNIARQRLRVFSTDEGPVRASEKELASVDVAYLTMMSAVTMQLASCLRTLKENRLFPRKERECLELLPQSAGHLMASTSKDIRETTFTILKEVSKGQTPKCSGSADVGNFGSVIAMRQILDDDDGTSKKVLKGTGDAAAIVSIYGPQHAFRCYKQIAHWSFLLFSSGKPSIYEYLDGFGQEQISCMAEQFIRAWKEFQARPIFTESMSCFLEHLGRLWPFLVRDGETDHNPKKHEALLDVLLLLRSCDDASVQHNWAKLIAAVGRKFGVSSSQSDQLEELLSSSPESPCVLHEGPAKLLSTALGFSTVVFSRKKEAVGTRGCIPIPGPPAYNGMSSAVKGSVARAGGVSKQASLPPLTPFAKPVQHRAEKELKATKEASRLGHVKNRLRISDSGPNQLATADDMRNYGWRTACTIRNRNISNRRNQVSRIVAQEKKVVDKGPSKMERIKAQHRAAREKKEQERNTLDSSRKTQGNAFSLLDALQSTSKLGGIRNEMKAGPSGRGKAPSPFQVDPGAVHKPSEAELKALGAAKKAAAKAAVVAARRDLNKRDLERFHGWVVNCPISTLLEEPRKSTPRLSRPDVFRTSEEYVDYWETLLREEFRAQLRQALEGERAVAAEQELRSCSPESLSPPWSCRTPFEVESPAVMDPSGCYKALVVKYCGEGSLRNSEGPLLCGGKDDFSCASLRSGDLVRVQMANNGRGHHDGSHASTDVSVFLGYVGKIEHRGRNSLFTINVRFPVGVGEPGPARALGLSKLMTMVTHNRQMTALWRVNMLPDSMLHLLYHPKSYWKRIRRELPRNETFTPANQLRGAILNALVADGLNESQVEAIGETVRITETTSEFDGASGAALLQGPPGTGKTSTIVAILSVLLAKYCGPRRERVPSRKRQLKCATGDVIHVNSAPFRILVCAPSNAAVDELLLRVMEKGLVTSAAGRACPRLLRLGATSKDERIAHVSVSELIERSTDFVWNDDPSSRRTEARSDKQAALFAEQEMLRHEVRQLSAQIGTIHSDRKIFRAAREVAVENGGDAKATQLREEQLAFENQDKELTDSLSQLHSKKQDVSRKLTVVDRKVKLAKKASALKSASRMANLVNSAQIVFSTLNSAGHDVLSHACDPFDVCIVDEAAQSVEPDVLIALAGVNKNLKSLVKRLILVGDQKQLPATVISNDQTVVHGLSRSLFVRLAEAKYGRVSMLRTQYRMHPVISRFPSLHFYGGRLLDGQSLLTEANWRPYHFDKARRFGPLSFLNTEGCHEAAESRPGGSGSVANVGEARIVCAALVTLCRMYPAEDFISGKVAVLTPYKRQVALMFREIQRCSILSRANIEVSTVDSIQGREKEVIILSTVRGGSDSNGIGFVKDERRMNVALTRARRALIVVGNGRSLAAGSSDWKALLDYCQREGVVRPVHSVGEMFPEAFQNAGSFRPAVLPSPKNLPSLRVAANVADVPMETVEELSESDSDVEEAEVVEQSDERKFTGVKAFGGISSSRPLALRQDQNTSVPVSLKQSLLRSSARSSGVQPSLNLCKKPAFLEASHECQSRRKPPPEPITPTVVCLEEPEKPPRSSAQPVKPSVVSRHICPTGRRDHSSTLAAARQVTKDARVVASAIPLRTRDRPRPSGAGGGARTGLKRVAPTGNGLAGFHRPIPPPPMKRARAADAGPSIAERDAQRLSALRGASKTGNFAPSFRNPSPRPPWQKGERVPTSLVTQSEAARNTGRLSSGPRRAPAASAQPQVSANAIVLGVSKISREAPNLVQGAQSSGGTKRVGHRNAPAAGGTKKRAAFSLAASASALDKTSDARRRATAPSKK